LPDAGLRAGPAKTILRPEEEALAAANNLESEKAALLRDQIRGLKRQSGQAIGTAKALAATAVSRVSHRKWKPRR